MSTTRPGQAPDPTVPPAQAADLRRRLSRRRALLFALVPLAALLFVAEVVIRLARAPTHFGSFRDLRTGLMRRNYPAVLDPTLGYAPTPGFASRDNHWGTVVSIDGDGMRRNGTNPPPPGERVIAVVGDSFTFGDQVDDDATWPAQLEVSMQQPVKNGGVFGYSLTQAVLRAEAMLDMFPVETLIVSFIPDDLTRSEYSKRYTQVPWFDFAGDGLVLRGVPIDHAAPSGDSAKVWKDRLGYSALVDAVLANTVRAWWFENEKQVTVPQLAGRGAELGKRLLERIAARCTARDTRLLVVMLAKPVPFAVEVMQHAESKGIRTLDLATRFVELAAKDGTLERRWFQGHMTREGNGWVAGEIAAVLRSFR
jgi:hypothetical protein